MTPTLLNTCGPEDGYLLHVRGTESQETHAWMLLRTEDFTPLSELARALGALSDTAKTLAATHGCALDERSVSRTEPAFPIAPAHCQLGRSASLREYTYADGSPDTDRFAWHLELLFQGKSIPQIIPVTGGVARAGESLFGRQEARRKLLEAIEQGPVMLLGPRRCGKTSLLQWLVDEPPAGRRALYLDLERIPDGASLAVELCFALARDPVLGPQMSLPELQNPALPSVPVEHDRSRLWRSDLYQRIGQKWPEFLQRLLGSLAGTPPLLLLLDEFGDFLDATKGGDDFDPFLTVVRQAVAGDGPHRLVITGSRSLEFLIEDLQIGPSFQRFSRFPVPPFEEQAARRLFEERLRGQQIRPSREVAERALKLTGHQVPFYLQMLADSLLSGLKPGDFSDTTQVDRTYHEVLLGYPGQAHFDDLERRLKSYDQYRQRRAGQQTLRLIAERGEVAEEELEFKLRQLGLKPEEATSLLVLLEEYFFVEKIENRWQFRVPVLRDYALRYYPATRL